MLPIYFFITLVIVAVILPDVPYVVVTVIIIITYVTRGYYKIGVHFFEKIKVIRKKGNCANNFQYGLNFSKKNLKVSYCQENNFFQPKLSRKDEKR